MRIVKRRTRLTMLLVLVMIVAILPSQYWGDTAKADDEFSLSINGNCDNLTPEFIENQGEANKLYNRFFVHLNELYGICMDDTIYSVNGILAEDFPLYFAGAYINNDGYLIVQITEECYDENFAESWWYQEFSEIVMSEDFFCHPVTYSYTELIEAMSDVLSGDIADALSQAGIQIIGVGIDDYRNAVEVNVGSQEEVALTAEILNSDIYIISVTEGTPQLYAYLHPGDSLSNIQNNPASFSAACRVRRNFPGGSYVEGFLTCAHGLSGTEYIYTGTAGTMTTYIGSSIATLRKCGGRADVAFIETTSSTVLDNVIYSTTIIIDPIYTAVGTTVYKKGMNGISSSTILNSTYSSTISGVYYYDIVKTGAMSAPGDSGGIVFSPPDSYNHANAIGIVLGGAVTESYYTKMGFDLAALQSGPITFTLY